jgi:transcriptional regulator NrdR family protein
LEQKAQPVLSNVDIPPIPDSWDDNYEAKIRERDTAIQQNARFEQSESQRLAGQAEAQRKSEREHFNRQQELSETLASSSKKLGIDKAVLDKSQEVLVKQINDSGRDMTRIVDRLLSDPMGGLMIQHLAANQLDMQDIIYANPEDAGFLLAEVKQKAALLKPQSSNAPSPAATLTGGAVPNKNSGDGTTYE